MKVFAKDVDEAKLRVMERNRKEREEQEAAKPKRRTRKPTKSRR